jgi:DNA polymerase family B, exonuclease domain
MCGYDTPDTKFFKVFVALPGLIPALKRIMEDGVPLQGVIPENGSANHRSSGDLIYGAFECNVPFVLRFMVDRSLAGAGWLTFPKSTYEIRPIDQKETHCQVRPQSRIISNKSFLYLTRPCSFRLKSILYTMTSSPVQRMASGIE